jgi:hypothetical protein
MAWIVGGGGELKVFCFFSSEKKTLLEPIDFMMFILEQTQRDDTKRCFCAG